MEKAEVPKRYSSPVLQLDINPSEVKTEPPKQPATSPTSKSLSEGSKSSSQKSKSLSRRLKRSPIKSRKRRRKSKKWNRKKILTSSSVQIPIKSRLSDGPTRQSDSQYFDTLDKDRRVDRIVSVKYAFFKYFNPVLLKISMHSTRYWYKFSLIISSRISKTASNFSQQQN